MIGYDYDAYIPAAAVKAAGCQAAIRYVMPQTPFWTKALRTAEALELLAAGIPIVSNFESTADRMKGGAQAGHDDAVQLLADWRALGAPAGLIGWFSADWDVQPTEVLAVLDYLHAAADVLGGKQYVGLYGGYRAVGAAADAGFAIWQTVAWSGGRWDPRAVVRQTGEQRTVGGVVVDVNQILVPGALGAWLPSGGNMGEVALSGGYANEWPDLASFLAPKFPAGQQVSVEVDAEWANFGSRAAAEYARQARNEIRALSAAVVQPVDVNALAAALAPHIAVTTDVGQLAADLIPHLPTGTDVQALADAVVHAVGSKLTA